MRAVRTGHSHSIQRFDQAASLLGKLGGVLKKIPSDIKEETQEIRLRTRPSGNALHPSQNLVSHRCRSVAPTGFRAVSNHRFCPDAGSVSGALLLFRIQP